MNKINEETNGKIFFDKKNNIEFKKIYQRRVTTSNATSGKVNLPAAFIGDEVIVAIPTKKLKRSKKK